MITFLKANIASLSASFLDYIITVLLHRYMHIDIVVSSVIGTLCGGIVNFIMGRKWVFDADNGDVKGQGIRYALVWCGNLLFNTLGVYLMAKVLRVHYLISKVVVSIVVAVTYNYFLQKRFVFRNVA